MTPATGTRASAGLPWSDPRSEPLEDCRDWLRAEQARLDALAMDTPVLDLLEPAGGVGPMEGGS